MRLSTRQKMVVARLLGRVVRVIRGLGGQFSSEVACRRRGVRWSLDLDEGVQLAIYLSVYERSTGRALVRLAPADAVVIDIGANIGAQALPLARRLGRDSRVIAVEPADAAIARLRQNRDMNPELADRVTLVHQALGSGNAPLPGTFYARWPLTPVATVHPVHRGALERSTAVSSTLDRLVDDLGLSRVDLIKLDVDGHECAVLEGAAETLARYRPTVVLEWCPYLLREHGESPGRLVGLLTRHGYRFYDERSFTPLASSSTGLECAVPKGGGLNVGASVSPLP